MVKDSLWQDLSMYTIENDFDLWWPWKCRKWTFVHYSKINHSKVFDSLPYCSNLKDLSMGICHGDLDLGLRSHDDLQSVEKGLLLFSRMLVAVLSWYLNYIVANDKTFARTYDMMTLALLQGYRVAFKVWKNELLLISRTFFTIFSENYYHIVANKKTFAWTYDKMTLTLV